jgi:hypothetical protein
MPNNCVHLEPNHAANETNPRWVLNYCSLDVNRCKRIMTQSREATLRSRPGATPVASRRRQAHPSRRVRGVVGGRGGGAMLQSRPGTAPVATCRRQALRGPARTSTRRSLAGRVLLRTRRAGTNLRLGGGGQDGAARCLALEGRHARRRDVYLLAGLAPSQTHPAATGGRRGRPGGRFPAPPSPRGPAVPYDGD